jgi:hypothetical protein
VRLAINHLFIKQRTGFLKFCFWAIIIGTLLFLQCVYLELPESMAAFSILFAFIGLVCGASAIIHFLIHFGSYVIFINSDEFKRRSTSLSYYKKSFRKLSSLARKQLIDQAKQTILNTPQIRQDFDRQLRNLSALNGAINQTSNNASQTANRMAYTAHQQVYNSFDAISFGNSNNKNNNII